MSVPSSSPKARVFRGIERLVSVLLINKGLVVVDLFGKEGSYTSVVEGSLVLVVSVVIGL